MHKTCIIWWRYMSNVLLSFIGLFITSLFETQQGNNVIKMDKTH